MSLGATLKRLNRERHRIAHDSVRIPTTADPGRPATVLFLVEDYSAPAGGIRVIYRHVDILNAAGIRARVLHQRKGFRCSWFANTTEVTDTRSDAVGPDDLLVVDEIHVDVLARRAPHVRHVVFNQSGHLTWQWRPELVEAHYRSANPPLATVVVSNYAAGMLHRAFPEATVRRVHVSVDTELFHPTEPRSPRIAYFGRRGADDIERALRVAGPTGALRGWEIDVLDGLTQEEVAARLRRARIVLTASPQEGFGLPVAEAMASGCYVVGYDGFGGRELFGAGHSRRVETGDIVGLADAIVETVERERREPGWLAAEGAAARAWIAREHAPAVEAAEVIEVYRALVAR